MKIQPWNRREAEGSDLPSRIFDLWEVSLDRGESTPVHLHETQEELIIALEGHGVVLCEQEPVDLSPGHAVTIPAGVSHSVTNVSSLPMRALSVAIVRPSLVGQEPVETVSAAQLETVIDQIPEWIDRPTGLQLIIQIFDIAGNLSEQIDQAIGLETETGLRTLEDVEKQVMDAIVRIASAYQGGSNLYPPRF